MYNSEEKVAVMIDSIKKLCEQKNVTLYSLAKEAGISSSTLSYLINGKTNPQIYTILSICNALGVTIGELLQEPSESVNPDEKCNNDAGETMLIESYRKLSAAKREILAKFIDMLLQYNEK